VGAEEVVLGPLDVGAVAELVGDARAAELYARSGGHPLFLVELAAAESSELPASVRDAVVERVDGLGDAGLTLRSAAVLGTEIDIDALAGVLGLPVPVLLEHTEAGVRSRIIEERGAALAFRHELVREALVADTTAARRAYIHREAARVLDDRPRHDPMEVAWHAERGGDFDAAATALVEAATIATDRHDAVSAEALLDRAIALHDTPTARLARARVRIARWDGDGARADAQHAVEHGGGAEALEVAAWVEYYRRDYRLAFSYAEEAFDRSTDAGVRASCLAMTGRVLHAEGALDQADERLTTAAASAPAAVRGFARVWLSGLRMHQGRLDEAHELVERALVDGTWLGHPFARHHGHMFRTLALGQRGRIPEAFAALDVFREVGSQAGALGVRFTAAADNVRSWLLRSVGRLEEADELAVRSFEATSLGGSATVEMQCAAALDLVDGRLLRGDVDGTSKALQRADVVEGFQGTMGWHHRQRYWLQQARFALLTGDTQAANELATRAADDAEARGSRRYMVLGRAYTAVATSRLGEPLERDDVDAALRGLDHCAAPEAWLVTAELASASREERWWREAERRAGALIAAAGADGESLRCWVGERFSALGR
jgi:tetratricopeptide (TPR) repeat protein